MIIHNNIEEYTDLKQCDFPFLKAIKCNRKVGQSKQHAYDIELIFCKSTSENDVNLRIRCIHASDIKIGRLEGHPGLFVDIVDIRERQLENCRFSVTEEEEGAFSFKCEEFFVDLIKDDGSSD